MMIRHHRRSASMMSQGSLLRRRLRLRLKVSDDHPPGINLRLTCEVSLASIPLTAHDRALPRQVGCRHSSPRTRRPLNLRDPHMRRSTLPVRETSTTGHNTHPVRRARQTRRKRRISTRLTRLVDRARLREDTPVHTREGHHRHRHHLLNLASTRTPDQEIRLVAAENRGLQATGRAHLPEVGAESHQRGRSPLLNTLGVLMVLIPLRPVRPLDNGPLHLHLSSHIKV